jgi:uncharacterized protein (DUF302 family)
MHARIATLISATLAAALLSVYLAASSIAHGADDRGEKSTGDGIVRVGSVHTFQETVARLKQDVAAKGIMMFSQIDQAKLAADAGIALRPSTLLVFGNPPLGVQFITSRAEAGLDWPVRLLVYEDASGKVWTAYTDFDWIARRHRISDREQAFKMASSVVASITASVAAK